jgi:hypothetical protein
MQRAQRIKEEKCGRCFKPIIWFTSDEDLRWRIELLPIDANLAVMKQARIPIFVFNETTTRWVSKFGTNRDWRPTAVEHQCSAQMKEKENKR